VTYAIDRTPALPVIALVGRPNVGKSAIFNRIVGARRAIVDDVPGVTRDRLVAVAHREDRSFLCVDTGGFDAAALADPSTLTARIREQALAATEDADCVVCVLDGQAGLSPADQELVRLLTRTSKPLLVAINKIDHPVRDANVAEFYRLGVDPLLPISAAHNRGIDTLVETALTLVPVARTSVAGSGGTRVALMGRPNVGKSSLLNCLLGFERVMVSHEPGTTRDTVDTPVLIDGRPYVLIDTAGIRKRGRVADRVERHGAVRALGTLSRSDLVLMVLDATQGITDQDARLIGRVADAGRAGILLANKWDLLPRAERSVRRWRHRIEAVHPALASLPLVPVSAVTGAGLADIFPLVQRVDAAYRREISTPELNRVLRRAVAAHPPPSPGGRPLRLFYVTQIHTAPPEIVVFASAPSRVPAAYRRYLFNQFSKAFDLTGVPLGVRMRPRREAPVEQPTRPVRDRPPRPRRSSARKRTVARPHRGRGS